jgi:hypothetical protein
MTRLSLLKVASQNHEGKRREKEKEKENILFKFGRLAWREVDFRREGSVMASCSSLSSKPLD